MIRIRRGTIALLLGAVLATLLCAACPEQPQARARTVPLELGVTVFSMWRDWDQHDLWCVEAWEIWNEPNCIGGCGNGSPDQFVGVLKAGSFDALAVHPYQDPATSPPDAPSEGSTYRFSTLPQVHALMEANGDGAKPIWLTEFGWTTATSGPRPGVDEATQARFLTDAVRQIQNDYPYVTHAFWFCLRDRDDWTPYENGFGLLGVDGTPKPGFAALQRANSMPKEAL